MKEFGAYLRQAREKGNISLKDVQEATKIRLRYLEAIEDGDFEIIPGEVYRRGFLINYANSVGLDQAEVLQKYTEAKNPGQPVQSLQNVPVPSGTEASKSKLPTAASVIDWESPKRQTGLKAFSIVIGVAFVFGMGFLVAKPLLDERPAKDTKVVAQNPTKVEVKPELKTVPQNEPADPTIPPEPLAAAPIYVEAEFTARVWVKVDADGDLILSKDGAQYDAASPKQIWKADQTMTIVFGNAGGVKLRVNGNEVGPIGNNGERKEIKLDSNGIVAP